MKICILTFGTRGDVQPYVALGRGLKAAGHEVTIATLMEFKSLVQAQTRLAVMRYTGRHATTNLCPCLEHDRTTSVKTRNSIL